MNMTLKEMLLQVNDRLSYIEDQMHKQNTALASLTESCSLIAHGLKRFMDDFYGPPEPPANNVRVPVAIDGNLLEKIKDPNFIEELKEKFKKETESMAKFEEEMEKIKEQITKGIMGES